MLPSLCKFRILNASKGPKECGLGPCAILADELRPKRPAVAVSVYKLFFLLPNFIMMQEAMQLVEAIACNWWKRLGAVFILELCENCWVGMSFDSQEGGEAP